MFRVLSTSVCLLGILGIGVVDYLTGPDVGFSLFYLLPIVWAAWRLGRRYALVAAALASVAWFGAELALLIPTRHVGISVWNGLTRLVIFTAMALLVSAARMDRDRLHALSQRLAELLRREADLARTDLTTGLPNSRYFLESMATELARAKRAGTTVSLAYLDVDNFKKVNDAYGHAAGDEFLRDLANALRETIRAGDFAGRLGGDEFGLLLVGVDEGGAAVVAHRCIERVEKIAEKYPGCGLGLSVGIVMATPGSDTDALIARADSAMYAAKDEGKGRIVTRSAPGP